MRFDDRLQTLLAAPVVDQRDRAVRWRQLVDLLSRAEPTASSEAAVESLELVRSEAFAIDEAVRAATLRSIAGRPLSPALLEILAAQPVRIAAPLFAGLTLSAADAARVLAAADDEVRALVTVEVAPEPEPEPLLEPEREPELDPEPVTALDAQAEPAAPTISAMIDRIEQVAQRRAPLRQSAPAVPRRTATAVRPVAAGGGRSFEWESNSAGYVAWVEGAPRGALVGRPLGGDGVGLLERQAATRIAQHHPFVDVPLALGEMLAGRWSATGVPAFDPASGRFLGYRGLARRIDGEAARPAPGSESDADALRELVHEIKTPLNAIIGFAEIIDGQYLGPAHSRYRERAASIVGQARILLEAVEDLDFAAKLRADRAAPRRGGASHGDATHGGGRLSDLFPPIAAELEACLAANGGLLELDIDDERHRCALSPELAGRLLRRLLLSLCKLVGPSEIFRIAVTRRGAMCLLTIARPRRIEGVSEAQLVDPAFDAFDGDVMRSDEGAGIGLGFALRLVRGLAKVAGGSLVIDEHRITLELPALDA